MIVLFNKPSKVSLGKTFVSIRNLFVNNEVKVKDPFTIFTKWHEEANQLCNAQSMYLTTVSKTSIPSCRVSTCIDFSRDGFRFPVNIQSQTGIELKGNTNVALTFGWPIGRMVRVEGIAKDLHEGENSYVKEMSYEQKILAENTKSGKLFESRQALVEYVNEISRKNLPITNSKITLFILIPTRIEFYQNQKGQFQERLQFDKHAKVDNKFVYNGEEGWSYTVLSP